jgi:hypothetical protein
MKKMMTMFLIGLTRKHHPAALHLLTIAEGILTQQKASSRLIPAAFALIVPWMPFGWRCIDSPISTSPQIPPPLDEWHQFWGIAVGNSTLLSILAMIDTIIVIRLLTECARWYKQE